MERLENWQSRLETYLGERLDTPLIWGQSDCCLFVADAVQEISGADIAEWFRGKYKTRKGAFDAMKEFCQGSVQETFQRLAGVYSFKEVDKTQTGDIVLLKADACDPVAGRLANGMTVGMAVKFGIISQGLHGLVLHDNPEIVTIWRP